VDEKRVFRPRKIGLRRPEVHLRDLLAAACVLAAIIAGCASPAATDPRDAIASASSPAEPSGREKKSKFED